MTTRSWLHALPSVADKKASYRSGCSCKQSTPPLMLFSVDCSYVTTQYCLLVSYALFKRPWFHYLVDLCARAWPLDGFCLTRRIPSLPQSCRFRFLLCHREPRQEDPFRYRHAVQIKQTQQRTNKRRLVPR